MNVLEVERGNSERATSIQFHFLLKAEQSGRVGKSLIIPLVAAPTIPCLNFLSQKVLEGEAPDVFLVCLAASILQRYKSGIFFRTKQKKHGTLRGMLGERNT